MFNLFSWLYPFRSRKATAERAATAPAYPAFAKEFATYQVAGKLREPVTNASQTREDSAPLANGDARMEFVRGVAAANDGLRFGQVAPGRIQARVVDSTLYAASKDVKAHFTARTADVGFHGTNILAPKGDVDFTVRAGASQWITGQTRQTINAAPRPVLLGIWRKYLRNPLVEMDMTAEQLDESFQDTRELRNFIATYLLSEQRG